MKVDNENYELPTENTHVKAGLRPIDYIIISVFFVAVLIVLILNFSQYRAVNTKDVSQTVSVVSVYAAGDSQNAVAPNSNVSVSSEQSVSNNSTVSSSSEKSNSVFININTATKEELMELSYIGEAKAQNIIDYRNTYGPFTDPHQIINVTGIGEKIYERNKDIIVV